MNEKDFESRILQIEERNKRVDGNKRWETSWVRRGSIAFLTYVSVVVNHIAIGAKNVFVISAVPVMGFVLSTLSLQFIRSLFEKRNSGEK